MKRAIGIVGSGPAGLMAASVLASHGLTVTVFEKNRGPGRKLLIAGASGLNITNSLSEEDFAAQYEGSGIDWRKLLRDFSPTDWLAFIHRLGLETFLGTSGRYFVREMKASGLLRRWIDDLREKKVRFQYGTEWTGLTPQPDGRYLLSFADGSQHEFGAVLLALGGASWLDINDTPQWPAILTARGIHTVPFAAANCGFDVDWKPEFLREAAQQPLKNVVLSSPAGNRKGDILITEYGVEGTPVYACGRTGTSYLDLKADLSEKDIQDRLDGVRENLAPLRRAQRALKIGVAAQALLYHHAPADALGSNAALAHCLKHFPLVLLRPRPLSEAISSTGGIALDEINADFSLKKTPGVYAVGEMLDWSAPTGGFLIQACVSQGYAAAQAIWHHASPQ